VRKIVTRWNLSVFIGLTALQLSWALAMPVSTGPDEPAHVYRADSLWNGQFRPKHQAADGAWWVRVPTSIRNYAESTTCTRFHADVPASCAKVARSSADHPITEVKTGAGRYLPFYYYSVGWPTRLSSGLLGFYLMRLMSLLVAAALLTSAVMTILKLVDRRWAGLGLALALTPQLLWVNSLVNPNSWEIDAALLVWAAGLAGISNHSSESRRVLATKFMVGSIVLLLTRRLSPLWLILILAGLAAVWSCLPEAARSRAHSSKAAAAAALSLIILAATSAWWHITQDLAPVSSAVTSRFNVGSMIDRTRTVLPDLQLWLKQSYGGFGWLDTPSPRAAFVTWLGSGSLLAGLAIRMSQLRLRLGATLFTGLALCAAVPLAFVITFGSQVGLHFWQGRYTMPFSQGIPLALAATVSVWYAQRQEQNQKSRWFIRILRPLPWALWFLSAITFVSALHRYTSGQSSTWLPGGIQWTPPGSIVGVIVLYILGAVVIAHTTTAYQAPIVGDQALSAGKEDVGVRDLRELDRSPAFLGESG
jgi:hypothetical protein